MTSGRNDLTSGLVTTDFLSSTTLQNEFTSGQFVECAEKCIDICGEGNIKNCVCQGGNFVSVECADVTSKASGVLTAKLLVIVLAILYL